MGLRSICGIILTFLLIYVFVHINTEDIDLIAELNYLENAKKIINYQETNYNRKPIWYLDLTDNNSRKLILSANKTKEILELLIQQKDFEICAILSQDKDNSGTIFSITNKKSTRLFEIKVVLKKNNIRVIYSPDILFRGSVIERIDYNSPKNPWHSICFQYTSHNKQFSVMLDCSTKVNKRLRFHLPNTKLQEGKIDEFKIWIGQRNGEHSYFKGIIKQMIFSSKSNLSLAYCATLVQTAITTTIAPLTHIKSVTARLNFIEKEFMDIKMKLSESENKSRNCDQCQCFPLCISSSGETKSYGQDWKESFCRNCTCTLKGKICVEETCPNLPCYPKITESERCCQRCGYNCQYHGNNYFHTENFTINCLKCHCNDGSLSCRRINPKLECPKLTCTKFQQMKVSGQCCRICKKRRLCDFSKCGTNAICVQSTTSFSCQCKIGFQGNPYRICEDINECRNGHSCPSSTECINNAGSFKCVCKPGFVRRNSTTMDCRATCVKKECKNNSTCIAPEKCECTSGYTGDQCDIDIDECKLGLVRCPQNSDCLNIPGSYVCHCKNGYRSVKGDTMSVYYDHQCKDIDECMGLRGKDYVCDISSTCVNTDGGYNCLSRLKRNDCDAVKAENEILLLENGNIINHCQSCTTCRCFNGDLNCFAIKCDCSLNNPKPCCRKCFQNECNSSISTDISKEAFQKFDCMSANSSCPNKECPRTSCHDSIEIPGQCCKFCRSNPITSCLLYYNSPPNLLSSFNNFIPACFHNTKRFESGDRFIFQSYSDGSCIKCLCWNQYFCCGKTFDCRF